MSRIPKSRVLFPLFAVSLTGCLIGCFHTTTPTIVTCKYSGTNILCASGTCPSGVTFPASITGSFTYQVVASNPPGSGDFMYTNFTQAAEKHATDYTLNSLSKVGSPGTAGSLFTIVYKKSTGEITLQANVLASAQLPATQVTITLPCSTDCSGALPSDCSKYGPSGTISITSNPPGTFVMSGPISMTP